MLILIPASHVAYLLYADTPKKPEKDHKPKDPQARGKHGPEAGFQGGEKQSGKTGTGSKRKGDEAVAAPPHKKRGGLALLKEKMVDKK